MNLSSDATTCAHIYVRSLYVLTRTYIISTHYVGMYGYVLCTYIRVPIRMYGYNTITVRG